MQWNYYPVIKRNELLSAHKITRVTLKCIFLSERSQKWKDYIRCAPIWHPGKGENIVMTKRPVTISKGCWIGKAQGFVSACGKIYKMNLGHPAVLERGHTQKTKQKLKNKQKPKQPHIGGRVCHRNTRTNSRKCPRGQSWNNLSNKEVLIITQSIK